jgi:hypothetical protein
LATQPTFTWSKLSGPGSISTTGLYFAPASGSGTAVIQAKAGGKSKTATVTITSSKTTLTPYSGLLLQLPIS